MRACHATRDKTSPVRGRKRKRVSQTVTPLSSTKKGLVDELLLQAHFAQLQAQLGHQLVRHFGHKSDCREREARRKGGVMEARGLSQNGLSHFVSGFRV